MCSLQFSPFYRTCFCSSFTFFQGYVALQCLKSCWSCHWVQSIFGFMETWKALLGATCGFFLWCRSVLTSSVPFRLDMWHGPTMAEYYFRVCASTQIKNGWWYKSGLSNSKANSFLNVTLNVNNMAAVFPEPLWRWAMWKPPLVPTHVLTTMGPSARPLTAEYSSLGCAVATEENWLDLYA